MNIVHVLLLLINYQCFITITFNDLGSQVNAAIEYNTKRRPSADLLGSFRKDTMGRPGGRVV